MIIQAPTPPGAPVGYIVIQMYNAPDNAGGRTLLTSTPELANAILRTNPADRARAIEDICDSLRLFLTYPERWSLQEGGMVK